MKHRWCIWWNRKSVRQLRLFELSTAPNFSVTRMLCCFKMNLWLTVTRMFLIHCGTMMINYHQAYFRSMKLALIYAKTAILSFVELHFSFSFTLDHWRTREISNVSAPQLACFWRKRYVTVRRQDILSNFFFAFVVLACFYWPSVFFENIRTRMFGATRCTPPIFCIKLVVFFTSYQVLAAKQ